MEYAGEAGGRQEDGWTMGMAGGWREMRKTKPLGLLRREPLGLGPGL